MLPQLIRNLFKFYQNRQEKPNQSVISVEQHKEINEFMIRQRHQGQQEGMRLKKNLPLWSGI